MDRDDITNFLTEHNAETDQAMDRLMATAGQKLRPGLTQLQRALTQERARVAVAIDSALLRATQAEQLLKIKDDHIATQRQTIETWKRMAQDRGAADIPSGMVRH
jgi:hypothetical protein